MIIFLPFESQQEIDVIFITYLTVICFDPITPQSVVKITVNLLIDGKNQRIVVTNLKPPD